MANQDLQEQPVPIGEPHVVLPGESRVLSMLGATLALHAVGEDTGGAWSLVEYMVPARFAGLPAHYHARTTEAWYVLEGTLTVRLGEHTVEAPSGSFVLVPRGRVHGWMNRGQSPARFLALASPAGSEGFLEALAGLIARAPEWPPVDVENLDTLAAKYDHHRPEEPIC